MALSSFVSGCDQVILDLDGCVWVGDEPTPPAPEAIAAMRAAGKPEPPLFAQALERLVEGRTPVVGDRLDVDLPAAVRSGLDAALVLTGRVTRADGEAAPGPATVSDSLGSLVLDS